MWFFSKPNVTLLCGIPYRIFAQNFPRKVKPLDMVNHVIVKPIYPRRNGTSTAGDYQGGAIEHDIPPI